jgi:hypothetical protein
MRSGILAAATRVGEGFRPPRRSWFWLGVILMTLSFGIYPAYALMVFSPISWWDKFAVVVGLAAISWSMFLVGSAFAGKQGLAQLRQRFSSWRVRRGTPVDR